jgi:hypothetical protein
MRWALALLLAAGPLSAQPLRLFGSNEIVFEDYDVSGDRERSPFRLDGTFVTNRLALNLERSGLLIRGEFLGTNSDYLPDQGFVISTLFLQYENGAAAVPYRVEAGDVFADLSRRVLQRQVRGTSVEFQPQFGRGTHSVVLLTGSGEPDWRDTFSDATDFFFTGASWAWQSESERTNLVGNVSSESATDRDHVLTSLYAKTAMVNGTEVEGEVSLQRGDDDAASVYAQVARPLGAFQWRLRYENNGERYLPLGAMGIMADRRIAEAHARWRPSRRWSVRGRVQQIEQQNVSIDAGAVTVDVQLRPALRMEATADVNRIDSREYRNVMLDLQDPIWSYRGSWRDSPDIDAHEHEVMAGRSFSFGRLSAGLGYRSLGDSDSWAPVVEASVRRGDHLLRLYYGFLTQRFTTAAFEDLQYQNRRLVYTFTHDSHYVSLEYGLELREPERSLDTESRRIALRYRYAFDL